MENFGHLLLVQMEIISLLVIPGGIFIYTTFKHRITHVSRWAQAPDFFFLEIIVLWNHIWSFTTFIWSFISFTIFQGAHDGEILTLSFTLSTQDISKEIVKNNYFLASGGRDCMIHLYDVKRCVSAICKDNLVGWLYISMTFWLYVAEILILLTALMIIRLQWLLSKLAAMVAGSSVVVLTGMLVGLTSHYQTNLT